MTNGEVISIIGPLVAIFVLLLGIFRFIWEKKVQEEKSPGSITLFIWFKRLSPPKKKPEKQHHKPVNPYQIGGPIKHQQYFFGRKDILASIIEYIEPIETQLIYAQIVGSQGSGKTSFLNSLQCEILNNSKINIKIIPVYLSGQSQFKSCDHFYGYMLRETLKAIEKRNNNTAKPVVLPEDISFETLRNSLEQASDKQWEFLMLLDDFDNLINTNDIFKPAFFTALRSLNVKSKISFITTTLRIFEQSEEFTSPLGNIFNELYYLGPLSEHDSRCLIEKHASRSKYKFKTEDIDFIIKIAGKMPFNIQKASYLLYDMHKKGIIGEDAWEKMGNAYKKAMKNFFKYQLNQLTNEEKMTLKQVSKKSYSNSFSGTLIDLENYGFIEQVDGQYKVLGLAFEEYLLNL